LNASGRLAHAGLGVALLLSKTPEEAEHYAKRLDQLNLDRRTLDQDILNESLKLLETEAVMSDNVVVLSGKGWHSGVIGIAASKLVERLNRPVVVISESDGIARGSARSVGTVNIYELLKECSSHFLHFGGHKEAAGFSILPDQIPLFKQTMRHVSGEAVDSEALRPVLTVDATLNPSAISEALVSDVDRLEPFGQANSQPLFFSDQFEVVDTRLVGDGKHVKATLANRDQRQVIDAIGFNLGSKFSTFQKKEISLVFHIGLNSWQGRVSPQLQVVDVKCRI
jgi:single-stranded-DNA-specific exonuclease